MPIPPSMEKKSFEQQAKELRERAREIAATIVRDFQINGMHIQRGAIGPYGATEEIATTLLLYLTLEVLNANRMRND